MLYKCLDKSRLPAYITRTKLSVLMYVYLCFSNGVSSIAWHLVSLNYRVAKWSLQRIVIFHCYILQNVFLTDSYFSLLLIAKMVSSTNCDFWVLFFAKWPFQQIIIFHCESKKSQCLSNELFFQCDLKKWPL